MKLSKSLGQIFLKDKHYIDKIIASLDIAEETVVEIGPGSGEITELLLNKAKFIYCIEVDGRFVSLLQEKFKNISTIEIIRADIIQFPLKKLAKEVIVFGNAPYQISNSLIRYLVSNRKLIKRAYLAFQKEFVHKLMAEVSTEPYGYLSCYLQYYAKLKKLFDIPAGAFFPVPKVDSSFMKLEFYEPPPYRVADEHLLFKIIRLAFSQRRKKIINSLQFLRDKPLLLTSLNINCDSRAENLSLEDYCNLANALSRRATPLIT